MASGLSRLNLWIEPSELDAGIGGGELPVDPLLTLIAPGFPGLGFPTQGVEVGYPAVQTLPGEDAEFQFGDIEPTAVLGGVVNLQPLCQAPGRVRREGFVERAQLVGVEVIADQPDPCGLGILDLQERSDLGGPVDGGSPLADVDLAAALERFGEHEHGRGAVALVFVVHPWRVTGKGRQGRAGLLDELHRLFIHANQRDLRIGRQAISIEQIFHPGHELAVLLGRNHPRLTQMGLEFVFLSTRRTLS